MEKEYNQTSLMDKEIKSEIAFAIVLACDELIGSLKETDNIYANLVMIQLKIGLSETMQNMAKNLNQEHLNLLGERLTNKQ